MKNCSLFARLKAWDHPYDGGASDGSMQIRWEALPEMPDYLKNVIEEMK